MHLNGKMWIKLINCAIILRPDKYNSMIVTLGVIERITKKIYIKITRNVHQAK